MPRESIITVLRSTATDTPTGMTFGELAYSDLNGKLFVGKNNGTSLWIGAGVTDGSITNNSQYLLPTQSAVKTYVDGIVGGGSVVNSVNNASGSIVVTGDNGAIIKSTSSGTNAFTARVATSSLTGVAAFNSTYYSVSAAGVVTPTAPFQVTGDTVSAGSGIGIVRSGTNVTVSNAGVRAFNGLTGTVQINGGGAVDLVATTSVGDQYNYQVVARLASTSLTGVASFNSGDFTVSAAGQVAISTSSAVPYIFRDTQNDTASPKYGSTVTLTGANGVETDISGSNTIIFRGVTATATTSGVASFPAADFTITSGAVNLKDVVRSFNGVTGAVGVRIATTSLTGVASFNSTYYSVSGAGAVTPTAPFQVTGDTVSAGSFIGLIRNGTQAIVQNTGVHTFNGLTGTVSMTGDGGAIYGTTNNTIAARVASTSLTGVASFNGTHFTVSAAGAVSSNGITVKASSTDTGNTLNLGGTLTITGAANQISVTRSTNDFTIGLPNDVTIPGNLTVNGTVVTANVDNFVVEDPLFMLGTGNAADSVDLGFYSLYTSSGAKYAGFFRDASDSGKYKLFTGLTVEPTTTVNDAGAGYTIATLVAKIDGGTF